MNPLHQRHRALFTRSSPSVRGPGERSSPSGYFWVSCALWLGLTLTLPVPAWAQQRRAILWLVEVAPESTVQREVVTELFRDLLQSATDSEHIIEVEGMSEHIRDHGMPVPGCLAGISPCEDVIEALAEELRLDIIATVRVYGQGNRLRLTVRGVSGSTSRVLQFEGENLRQVAFQVVTDFVGATGTLTVTSRPTGATVFLDDEQSGRTPFQLQVPAGIYQVRIELEGYQPHLETVEIRPEQSRLIDLDLPRQYAQLLVQTMTQDANLTVDGQPVGDYARPLRLEPGSHTILLEAPDYLASERTIELEPGSDSTLRIDLVESPQARRRRRMGYIYERPFYVRGAFRFAGSRSGFGESEGSIDGIQYTVECPRANDGSCTTSGIPVNSTGIEAEIGYSFRYLEVSLLTFTYAAAQIGGSSGDGRTLTLFPNEPGDTQTDELAGRFTGVTRIELKPLAVGARILLTDVWSLYLHGGFGWFKDFFDVEGLVGEKGGFSRSGFLWSLDTGIRFYLNDSLFLQGAFLIGDDLSHDDSDLSLGFNAGIGFNWEDVLGIDRLFGGDSESDREETGETFDGDRRQEVRP